MKKRDSSDLVRLLNLATMQMRFWLFFFRFRDAFEIHPRTGDHEIQGIPEMLQSGKTSRKTPYFGAP